MARSSSIIHQRCIGVAHEPGDGSSIGSRIGRSLPYGDDRMIVLPRAQDDQTAVQKIGIIESLINRDCISV